MTDNIKAEHGQCPSQPIREKVTSIFNTIQRSRSPGSATPRSAAPGIVPLSRDLSDYGGPFFHVDGYILQSNETGVNDQMEESLSLHENIESHSYPDIRDDAGSNDGAEEGKEAQYGGASDEEDESDASDASDEEEAPTHNNDEKDLRWKAPSIIAVSTAYSKLQPILRPPRNTGYGHKHAEIDDLLRSRLEAMAQFLWNYADLNSRLYGKWIAASIDTAQRLHRGPWYARRLREWSCTFIEDAENLPLNIYGTWNKSKLDDEDLQQEIFTHLQSIGKYVCAMDLVRFTEKKAVQRQYGLKKAISLRTAQYWMNRLGYRWTLEPSGQYVDGHEREDVVEFRQNKFLPKWKEIEPKLRAWALDGKDEHDDGSPQPKPQRTVAWFHDESTFYAHDRRRQRWVHKTESAVPRPKGEGVSVMVADFVSADYGWLKSPDGTEAARVVFKAGKARDGYFTNDDITKQLDAAFNIIEKYYLHDNHVFIFDNATTHVKRPDTALSARRMTKGPSENFGVEVTVVVDGKVQYQQDGKPKKKKMRMGSGKFANGDLQNFYDERGVFKGMTTILEERRQFDNQIPTNPGKLLAACKGFKCAPGAQNCCQRRILYDQPDFQDQESVVEMRAQERGFTVMFLPKFHCELNLIEQCWCHAKRRYREYPPSSKEDDVEKNMLASLESVTIETMRK